MDYKKCVKVIRSVTGLYQVNVLFDDINADLRGGAYAGFSGFEDLVVSPDEEALLSGFFDFEDFLEQEHIKYYHVGLPKDIYKRAYSDKRKPIFQMLLESAHVPYSNEAIEAFVILHEFGHAHELYVKCNEDLGQYLRENRERNSAIYHMDFKGYSQEKQMYLYREIPSEKYADDFAKTYLKQVMDLMEEERLAA